MTDTAAPWEREHVDGTDHDAPVPDVGSRWIWEEDKPYAYAHIAVTEVIWNGEEWWVRTRVDSGKDYLNELSRFWEAVTPA